MHCLIIFMFIINFLFVYLIPVHTKLIIHLFFLVPVLVVEEVGTEARRVMKVQAVVGIVTVHS